MPVSVHGGASVTVQADSVPSMPTPDVDELMRRFETWIRAQAGSPSEYRLFLRRVADREREAVDALAPDDPLRAACLDTARRLERDAGPADLRSVVSLRDGGERPSGAR